MALLAVLLSKLKVETSGVAYTTSSGSWLSEGPSNTEETSMSVLLIVGPKCTLEASHAAQ